MNYEEAADYIKQTGVALNVSLISEEILAIPQFHVWSGSAHKHQHHYGKHGLCIHTAEVIKLCLGNNELLSAGICDNHLFLAGLFHDLGKMWDYVPIDKDLTEWEGAAHKRHIHHISRSAIMWHDVAHKHGVDEDEILHAILAHHGQREWGSPVSPNTKLAWMLHLCDSISARMYDAETWDHVKKE